MTLTSTERALCNSLDQKYGALITPLLNSRPGYKNLLNSYINQMRSTVFSPPGAVEQGVDDLVNQANGVMPGDEVDDLNRINTFMQNCPFFDEASPVSALLGSVSGLFDAIDNFINNISITVPEFGLAALADQLNKLLNGDGFPGGNNLSALFKMLDKLINCLNALCPGFFIENKINQVNDLYNFYNVDSNPTSLTYAQLNYASIYQELNLTPGQINNLNTALNSVTSVKETALSSVQSVANKLKLL